MKRWRKRVLALCIGWVFLALPLAGCGAEEGAAETAGPDAAGDYVYVPEYLGAPGGLTNLTAFSVAGDTVYLATRSYAEGEEGSTSLYAMNTDGTGLRALENFDADAVLDGQQGRVDFEAFIADSEGNLWVAETCVFYHYETPTGYVETEGDPLYNYYVDDGSGAWLRKLDATGAETARVDLMALSGGASRMSGACRMALDSDENLYLGGFDEMYVFDSAGNTRFVLDTGRYAYIRDLVTLGDGTVAAMAQDPTVNGYVLHAIDASAGNFGEQKLELPASANAVYDGDGIYLYYYIGGNSFYGYEAESGQAVELFNWFDCDMDSQMLTDVSVLDSGQIFCSAYQWNDGESANFSLALLRRQQADTVPPKTVLTLATQSLTSELREEVIAFNRANDTYRIEILDYSEYNTNTDFTAGLARLSAELIAGNIPDLLDLNGLPIRQYAAKGLLVDLYPYLDADEELSRKSLLPSVAGALEIDGKLYQAVSSFSILTVVGDADTVGGDMGWTMEEFLDLYAQIPEDMDIFSAGVTKDDILRYCLALEMDALLDWGTGTCSFVSDAFLDLLAFANLFPDSFSLEGASPTDTKDLPDRIQDGDQMLDIETVNDFYSLQKYQAVFGGAVTYKGFPTSMGVGSMLSVPSGIAITSACADKAGAWQFIRRIFTEEYQLATGWTLLTNQNAFDAMLQAAMTPAYETDAETGEYLLDENGEPIEASRGGIGWSLGGEYYAVTQAEADQLLALIESTDRLAEPDENILTIVREEAAPYFAGQKTAEEAAALIQSRASLYVSEQR